MSADRLTDPGEHFPYKLGAAMDALATPPAAGTRNHPEHWYTSVSIIRASDAYIAAQADVLRNPGDLAALDVYRDARDTLLAARAEHRAGRTATVIGADLTATGV